MELGVLGGIILSHLHEHVIMEYYFLLGIGGTGMSNLARYLMKTGNRVYGYDSTETYVTQDLIKEGAQIVYEEDVNLVHQDLISKKDKVTVVYSFAIHDDNVLLSFFKSNSYYVISRSEMFNKITKNRNVIAIAGTHGKTTSTVLMSHILATSGLNVVGFCGGISKNYNNNFIINGNVNNSIVVIEADEYKEFFLSIHPTIELITNVDVDHLDYYKTPSSYKNAFIKFINLLDLKTGLLVINDDFKNLVPYECKTIMHSYGSLSNAQIYAGNVHIEDERFVFDYVSQDVKIDKCRLFVPGYHNVRNALGVITVALRLGISCEDILNGLKTFKGVKKRFDIVYRSNKYLVIDDYAHHPTEMVSVINTVKTLYPSRKITVVFRPHLYSRTKDFFHEFVDVLNSVDCAIVLDVFAARENYDKSASVEKLVSSLSIKDKSVCHSDNLCSVIRTIGEHDIIINFGAGDSEFFVDTIINAISEPKSN